MTIKITPELVRALCPNAKDFIVDGIVEHQAILGQYGINVSPLRLAHFLAQIAHESAHFQTTREYASGAAYEGRKDLGNTKRGDGKKFRGRGLIQLTGRANYARAEKEIGRPLTTQPVLLEKFPLALEASCLYWKWRNLNRDADRDDIRSITKKINGGYNGFDDRKRYYRKARRILMDGEAATVGTKPSHTAVRTRELQKELAAFGYFVGPVDGIAGPRTEAAIMEFQRDRDIVTDGIPGPDTWDQIDTAKREGWKKPKPPTADATIDDLKKKGSGTIMDAAKGKGAIGVGGAGAAVIVADKALEVAEKADGWSDRLLSLSPVIVGALALAVGLYIAWQIYNSIQQRRLADHRSGAHQGR